ncbi:DnaJ domain-containing protein [Candidatus Nasuia deltocephalinicola]|uniref:DnaJ domain-containing protein n=1 Tax=Candidatus Nasuia deltocephalincola TaxID=1160784 RepID=UPI00216B1107|nr:DnaJ domain-containing protein [Candidatus Nasuia deltocephalinicola]
MKDYYKILGIPKDSSIEDVKMSYKKLAMKYHPDRNPGNLKAEEKFKEIKDAYDRIINKNKLNENDFNRGPFNYTTTTFTDFSNSESSLDDIFNVIFQKNSKKDNKNYFSLDVDLECCVYGSLMDIKIPLNFICDKCAGKGFKIDSDVKLCTKCFGAGFYTITQGIFTFKQKCSKCEGKGHIFSELCLNCKGLGRVMKDILCLAKLKKCSTNNSYVDIFYEKKDILKNIFIYIKIKNHPLYSRKEKSNDLSFDFFIDFIKSIFGGYLKIFTLYGFILYKISKYTQNLKLYKLIGFGLNFNNKKGNLYLKIIIEIISNITFYQWFLLNKLKISIDYDFNYNLIFNITKTINSFYNLVLNN